MYLLKVLHSNGNLRSSKQVQISSLFAPFNAVLLEQKHAADTTLPVETFPSNQIPTLFFQTNLIS